MFLREIYLHSPLKYSRKFTKNIRFHLQPACINHMQTVFRLDNFCVPIKSTSCVLRKLLDPCRNRKPFTHVLRAKRIQTAMQTTIFLSVPVIVESNLATKIYVQAFHRFPNFYVGFHVTEPIFTYYVIYVFLM